MNFALDSKQGRVASVQMTSRHIYITSYALFT
jgi:hypothetical protein